MLSVTDHLLEDSHLPSYIRHSESVNPLIEIMIKQYCFPFTAVLLEDVMNNKESSGVLDSEFLCLKEKSNEKFYPL